MNLKKSILISLLGHLAFFSIFSFSFGDKIIKPNFAQVSFLGRILESSDLLTNRLSMKNELINMEDARRRDIKTYKVNQEPHPMSNYYLKPALTLAFKSEKILGVNKPIQPLSRVRDSPVIMFYPHLPYSFLLYFKDREIVHIELLFNIISNAKTNYIAVKRKISSGNLEADLLTKRYINHYLFIQQSAFSLNNWQTVKIDLSKKND